MVWKWAFDCIRGSQRGASVRPIHETDGDDDNWNNDVYDSENKMVISASGVQQLYTTTTTTNNNSATAATAVVAAAAATVTITT